MLQKFVKAKFCFDLMKMRYGTHMNQPRPVGRPAPEFRAPQDSP